MNLTRQTHIGIEALVHAMRARGRLIQVMTVAKSCNTTPAHVAQVTRRLTRLGWLEARRGRGGGLTLAEGMEIFPLGEVIRFLQPPQKDRAPPSPGFARLFREAEQARLDYLNRFTIGDLVDDRQAHCGVVRREHALMDFDLYIPTTHAGRSLAPTSAKPSAPFPS